MAIKKICTAKNSVLKGQLKLTKCVKGHNSNHNVHGICVNV